MWTLSLRMNAFYNSPEDTDETVSFLTQLLGSELEESKGDWKRALAETPTRGKTRGGTVYSILPTSSPHRERGKSLGKEKVPAACLPKYRQIL